MPENPYLPDRGQQLAMMLMALGSGISGAAGSGRQWWEGISPGAALFGNSLGQANQAAAQWDLSNRAREQQESYRKLQEDNIRSQMRLREQEASNKATMGSGVMAALGMTPGMGVQSVPTMGPSPQGLELLKYFQEKGLGPAQAAAIVGNFQQESGFNPAATHDSGTGYGLGGWRLDRRDALNRYASLRGGNVADPRLQADFFMDEIRSRPEFGQFSQAKTPEEASAALMHYFRPAGYTPDNPTAGHGFANRVGFARGYAGQGPQVADAGGVQQASDLDPQTKAAIAAVARSDPEKAAAMLLQARQSLKKEDAFELLSPQNAQMLMGSGYDQTKTYQRNRVTGKIEPVGGSLVNIQNTQESAITQAIAKQDAERLLKIQENATTIQDTASKVRLAVDLFNQTYTGTGGNAADFLFKTLGSLGVESAANKANASAAATALINEMMPKMRAPGSGATSDFEMRAFAGALPALSNLPGGNEKIAEYWQRIADRALKVQEIAEGHIGTSKALTGTKYAQEVKALGPIFSKDELNQMQALAKVKQPVSDRPSLDSFERKEGAERPPLSSFGGPR